MERENNVRRTSPRVSQWQGQLVRPFLPSPNATGAAEYGFDTDTQMLIDECNLAF